jgi:hypothetical protein
VDSSEDLVFTSTQRAFYVEDPDRTRSAIAGAEAKLARERHQPPVNLDELAD